MNEQEHKYKLSDVHRLLTKNYGFTKSTQTLRRTIDAMALPRQKEAGLVTRLYTDDEVRKIADYLKLQPKTYLPDAHEQVEREEALREEWMLLAADSPEKTFLYKDFNDFRAVKLHIVRDVWRQRFYELRQQLKTDALFDNGFAAMTFDDDALKNDLFHLDEIEEIGNDYDEELLAAYNEYMDTIHDYHNYVTIK